MEPIILVHCWWVDRMENWWCWYCPWCKQENMMSEDEGLKEYSGAKCERKGCAFGTKKKVLTMTDLVKVPSVPWIDEQNQWWRDNDIEITYYRLVQPNVKLN